MVFKKILTPLILNVLLLLSLINWLEKQQNQLLNPQYILGWTLFFLTLFMSAYGLKKKLSTLPLGSNRTWYQLHIVFGVWCLVIFGFHTHWSIPNNLINFFLWLGFVSIITSGFLGYFLIKFLAPNVSARGERMIFNKIPQAIYSNRQKAIKLIQQTAASENGKPLVDYYNSKLKRVFQNNGHLWLKFFGYKNRLQRKLIELEELDRYLDSENQQRLCLLKELVKQKFMLSWQYTSLSILRNWTLLHVPIIWFTIILLVIHIVIQYAFQLRTPW